MIIKTTLHANVASTLLVHHTVIRLNHMRCAFKIKLCLHLVESLT